MSTSRFLTVDIIPLNKIIVNTYIIYGLQLNWQLKKNVLYDKIGENQRERCAYEKMRLLRKRNHLF